MCSSRFTSGAFNGGRARPIGHVARPILGADHDERSGVVKDIQFVVGETLAKFAWNSGSQRTE
jgi:hypothetical protein